ncbi:MAG: triose-phosphate isomerase [Planctomycetia bacterium]|nr:triose-phosphate isomerase [Planctomycetia bacterium]
MRRPFIAGNWKMNLNRAEAVALAEGLKQAAAAVDYADIAVCPSFVYIDAVAQALKGSNVGVGAQDCYFEGNGAFTGEVSVEMLKDIGCTYVILGHSERRHIIGESSELTNKKLKAVLAAGLIPILCIGEMLEQREAGATDDVNAEQFFGSLAGLTSDDMKKVVIAYEPVWAIGTGKVATPEQAQEVHAKVRQLIEFRFGKDVADAVRIQYGGSMKPGNAAELLAQADIDGGLIGGAALKVDSFMGIIEAAKTTEL